MQKRITNSTDIYSHLLIFILFTKYLEVEQRGSLRRGVIYICSLFFNLTQASVPSGIFIAVNCATCKLNATIAVGFEVYHKMIAAAEHSQDAELIQYSALCEPTNDKSLCVVRE